MNPVVKGSNYVGVLAGEIAGEDARVSRCGVIGAAVAASGECAGAFAGQIGGGAVVSECFAAGTVASRNNSAGGFAGTVEEAAISDCYAVADVSGKRYAGSFAGKIVGPDNTTSLERCYAAGAASGSQDAGGFAGALEDEPGLADCFAQDPDAATDGVTALDAAGMRVRANFSSWHTPAPPVWTQDDGRTQPYFARGLVGGKFILSGDAAIAGLGACEPGTNAPLAIDPQDRVFIGWTGTASYADRDNATTTVLVDNHRTVAAELGTFITDREGLEAIAGDLSGTYLLDADIDLAGADWTPIGFDGETFTGTFYGNGHVISNLVATNHPAVHGRGLFGVTEGATIESVTVRGTVAGAGNFAGGLVDNAVGTHIAYCRADCTVSNSASYTGGLVGGISDGTTVAGCTAAGTVIASGGYTGGLVGYCGGDRLAIRDSVSTADVTGGESAGGFVGYVNSGGLEITGCRADGFTGGRGKVGGFAGSVSSNSVATISGCVARGDVRSFSASYGGFVGEFASRTATNIDCWCSGAIWGTGGDLGAFAGNCKAGTNVNCSVYPYAAGPRHFCGNNTNIDGGVLSAADVAARSKDQDGKAWPAVQKHIRGATPIATAEDLLAVTNDLSGVYVLVADIDLGDATIEPIGIGTNANVFTGEFYGRGYKISGFTVDTTNRYAGFFGNIHGGRVSDLLLEGRVYSHDNDSANGVGGFAGEIQAKSLVDGCLFTGWIETGDTGKVGGFVGTTEDSPVILRCGAEDITLDNPSSDDSDKQFTGGFVGLHNNGFIKDCYATGEVSAADNTDVGGFAGHVAASARIATSWCSVSVSDQTPTSWVGAFVGNADGFVTDSYYDETRTAQLAQGTFAPGNSAPCAGIEAAGDMSAPNCLPNLDFDTTWEIDELTGTPAFRRGEQHVSFDPNGAPGVIAPRAYDIGTDYDFPPNPTWQGHAFLGWFDAADGGYPIPDGSRVTTDAARTFYAHWTDQQTVFFDVHGGQCDTTSAVYAMGSPYAYLPLPTLEGCLFLGWFDAGECVAAETVVPCVATRTLVARWALPQTVTFDLNGGESCPVTTLVFGQGCVYEGFEMPVWEDHKFLGWFDDPEEGVRVKAGMIVTSDSERTLYAHWAEQQIVFFAANGEGATCAKDSVSCNIGGTYAGFTTASWANHKFLGWFDAPEGGNRVKGGMPVTEAPTRTLYAHWKVLQQTVIFNVNGDGATCSKESVVCTVGKTYSGFTSAVWANHKFLGWFDAPEGGARVKGGMTVTDAAERTLYAHWKVLQQTVRFDPNGVGATCSKASVVCTVGMAYSGFTKPTWTNHTFLGWFDAPEGGGRVKGGMPVTEAAERTLYAHWKPGSTAKGLAISGFAAGRTPRAEGTRAATVPCASLTFEAEAGCVYELQWTPALGGEWTTLRRWVADADGESSVTFPVPADSSSGFFRLAVSGGE